MNNTDLLELSNDIVGTESGIDVNKYCEQLLRLYGALVVAGLWSLETIDEVRTIERYRIEKYGKEIESRITDVSSLISEYSAIAFYLANESLTERTSYSIATQLKFIFEQLLDSAAIDDYTKHKNRNIISETLLDFTFAAGNKNISSLRMAPIIRSHERNNVES